MMSIKKLTLFAFFISTMIIFELTSAVTVSEEPKPISNNENYVEDQLEVIVNTFLESSDEMKVKIKSVSTGFDALKKLDASSFITISQFSGIIYRNTSVIDVKEKLKKEAFVNHTLFSKCLDVFDTKFDLVIDTLHNETQKRFEVFVNQSDKNLRAMKEETYFFNDIINNHLEEEINSCRKDMVNCYLAKKYLKCTKNAIKILDSINEDDLKDTLKKLTKEIVMQRISDLLVEPVTLCLHE